MLGQLVDSFTAHTTAVTAVAYDDAGDLFTADAAGWIAAWDRYGQAARERVSDSAVTALSVGGGRLCFGNARRRVAAVSTRLDGTAQPITRHRRAVSVVDISPDGDAVVSNSGYGDLSLAVRIAGGEQWHCIGKRESVAAGRVYGAADWVNQRYLEWGLPGDVRLLRMPTFDQVGVVPVQCYRTYAAAFYGNNTMMVTLGDDFLLRFWIVLPGVEVARVAFNCVPPVRFVVAAGGRWLWVVSAEALSLVDLRHARVVMQGEYRGIQTVQLDAQGKRLACGLRNGHIDLWDVADRFVTKS